jgi:hypothetical protein
MSESPVKAMTPESLEGALTGADDRVLLNDWLPPQVGVVPNGAPVSVLHGAPYGAPLRLELGFKMVKWIA